MNVEIVNLADRMEFLDLVSQWLWQEWASDKPIAYIRYATIHNAQSNRIPMTFVALAGEEPVGTVSLWMNDLKCRQDLYPWMASLYVIEDKRNLGIGRKLQAHAVEEVKKLGYTELYLFTDHNGYYERLGWTYKELAPTVNGEYTKIYRRDLSV
ncbi:hypothetical protein PAECIP111893_02018 [Paenibacillus plantiphilus]|uniref:N-acetyltransferase domain-containing protein n=1 Tax=Paenibacillus plantiphilus TaxID=2905650 RepID=A0ABM9C612_9BACL|nr:GNAT family N-acetyltransferase [Paenibacillus plantiphilus]CAH1203633.1 hypothetical protein PAECIP111893_02018 [Paenibacillus plantiphilus]